MKEALQKMYEKLTSGSWHNNNNNNNNNNNSDDDDDNK